MLYFLVSFGVLLHVFYWGAGLAILTMPGRWKPFWPVLALVAGFVLQSTVVWIGAFADLPGTRSYAWQSEVIPAVLLWAGLRLRGPRALRDLERLAAVGGVCAAALAALVWPLAQASGKLTTASLGSCDPADFAAGGRVLMEFARHDRSGFIGLKEVVRVLSVDNFFDFWLRLNHFTPAALIALNGTIFRCAPYQITGIMTTVMLVGAIPIVFWVSRALMGYRGWICVGVAALYGFGPISWYAVYHVATGQLLAAPGVAIITWVGVALWRRPPTLQSALGFAGILAVGYTIVLCSYNFFVVFCLIPTFAFAAGLTLWGLQFARFARWGLAMLAPFVPVAALFWMRVQGIVDRFVLFRTYDFGWKIPSLTPEGWFGLVSNPQLDPLGAGLRWALGLALVCASLFTLAWGLGRRDRVAYVSVCLFGPALIGYGLLHWNGGHGLSSHASYDSYKLLSVFYPVLLPGICYWLRPRGAMSGLLALALCVLLASEFLVARRFQAAMARPDLIVDPDLADVGRIESMPQVESLNMRVPDMWTRLWASQFLLHRRQYFATHTYEGHINTPLRGAWDLRGGLVTVSMPDGDTVVLNDQFSVARVASPWYLRARPGEGWAETERLPLSNERWKWTFGPAELRIENPQARPLKAVLRVIARSIRERNLELWQDGRLAGSAHLGVDRGPAAFAPVMIPPGESTLEFRSDRAPDLVPGDTRPLLACFYHVDIEIQK